MKGVVEGYPLRIEVVDLQVREEMDHPPVSPLFACCRAGRESVRPSQSDADEILTFTWDPCARDTL